VSFLVSRSGRQLSLSLAAAAARGGELSPAPPSERGGGVERRRAELAVSSAVAAHGSAAVGAAPSPLAAWACHD